MKLRAFRNFNNPVSFDYEYWALARGVDAGGYLKEFSLLSVESGGVSGWVAAMQAQIVMLAGELPGLAGQLIPALLFGQGSALDGRYWSDLQLVGAVHLLVVSGLHLGFWIAAIVFFWRILIRVAAAVQVVTPVSLIRLEPWVLLAMLAVYCTLAGWGISLQRAFIMMLIGLWLHYSVGRGSLYAGYALTILVIAIASPMTLLQPGFIYSFSAVLILMYAFAGRATQWGVPSIALLLKAQLVLCLGMASVYWLFLQPVSIQGIVTNLIAVPLLGLFVLPFSILVFLFPIEGLIDAYNQIIGFLFYFLALNQPGAADLLIMPQGFWLLPLFFIGFWLIAPSGIGFKFFFACMLLMIASSDFSPKCRKLLVLDVGQGLAVLIQSDGFSGLYDTGAAYLSGFSLGAKVVAPNLRQSGIDWLDHVVVSHSDNDHAGGLAGVMRIVDTDRLLSGQRLRAWETEDCHSLGDDWQKTNDSSVSWRVLSVGSGAGSDNDNSCVVQYEIGRYRVLLPGDISESYEKKLVSIFGRELKSDVLVVAHHGSKTSSSLLWLENVEPQYAVISAGFNNRFGHPHDSVVRRLKEKGAKVLITAEQGAIEFSLEEDIEWIGWREVGKRLWSQN